jgi:hypothetical protein
MLMKETPVMPANAFIGKSERPTEFELVAELGPAKVLWDELLADLARDFGADVREWNSYSAKAGWSLRVKCKKRAIVYLSPGRNSFRASFALGDKAMQAARQSNFPQRVIKIIDEAKRYPEGTAVRIEVTGPRDIAVVKKLASVKMEN